MVTMSRGAVLRPDAVLLHEFAHMWFGNSVSPTDWQGMWLNEGFAMYTQQWFERHGDACLRGWRRPVAAVRQPVAARGRAAATTRRGSATATSISVRR